MFQHVHDDTIPDEQQQQQQQQQQQEGSTEEESSVSIKINVTFLFYLQTPSSL